MRLISSIDRPISFYALMNSAMQFQDCLPFGTGPLLRLAVFYLIYCIYTRARAALSRRDSSGFNAKWAFHSQCCRFAVDIVDLTPDTIIMCLQCRLWFWAEQFFVQLFIVRGSGLWRRQSTALKEKKRRQYWSNKRHLNFFSIVSPLFSLSLFLPFCSHVSFSHAIRLFACSLTGYR